MQSSYHNVNNARLVLLPAKGDPWQLPIGRFELQFARNELPQATLRPALGQNFRSGKTVTLSNIKEGMPARLYLTRDGVERLLFDGYVQRIGTSDNSSLFNSWVSAEIVLKHLGSVLYGAPTQSYIYARKANTLWGAMAQNPYRVNPVYDRSGDAGNTTTTLLYAMGQREVGPARVTAWYPAAMLDFLTKKTIDSNYPVVSPIVKNLLQIYGPANLSPLKVTPSPLLLWLYNNWCAGLNSNVWTALSDTANKMFLSVLPYNNGLWLANPLSLLRKPSKFLRAREIINMTTTLAARDFPEPVDGVVLNVPCVFQGDVENNPNWQNLSKAEQALIGAYRFVYPPTDIAGAAGAVRDNINRDRYYHFLSMPDWLSEVNEIENVGKPAAKGTTTYSPEALQIGDRYAAIGPAVAREMYAQFKATRTALQLTLPWREDLMPGTVVAVENTPDQTISFLGATLYGMIESTTFVCDVLQNAPALLTRVQLVAVRSEIDNQPPPTGFGLDASAMFEGAWVGMDLQGKLLTKPPAFKALPPLAQPYSTVP
jgi:hypothetical protein